MDMKKCTSGMASLVTSLNPVGLLTLMQKPTNSHWWNIFYQCAYSGMLHKC